MKAPWENYPHIWSSQAKFFAWVRGGIRFGLWNKAPQKLEFIKKNRVRIPNPNTRGRADEVWGGECGLCNQIYPQNKLQVDHKTGNHSLKDFEDITTFIKSIVLVCEDDLQFACKVCHDAKSLSEKQNMSFEEAMLEKQVIAKLKATAKEVDAWLLENGYTTTTKLNAKSRREAVREVLSAKIPNPSV